MDPDTPAPGSGGAPMPTITEADLDRIARLARLRLAPGDRQELLERLAAILEHAAALGTLPLDGVEPLSHPHDDEARLDDDEPRAPLARERLGAMAPAWDGRFIEVPKVLGGG